MALTQISTQGIKDGTITGTDLATNIDLVDNQKIRFGDSPDLEIYHSGTASFISDVGGGVLKLTTDGLRVRNAADNQNMIKADQNDAVELYHNNALRLKTESYGISITGSLISSGTLQSNGGNIQLLSDSQKIFAGAGQDLGIFHDGTNSFIENTTGNLHIRPKAAEEGIKIIPDGAVELYHDGSTRFESTSAGATVTGSLGIDTTNPDQKLHLAASGNGPFIRFENTDTTISTNQTFGGIEFESRDTSAGSAGVISKIDCIATGTFDGTATNGGGLRFHTSGTNSISLQERCRIDASGNVLFGDAVTNGVGGVGLTLERASGQPLFVSNTSSSSRVHYQFKFNGTNVGSITTSTTATNYTSNSSDRSLKKNFEEWTENTLNLFKNINPQKFNFISEEDTEPKTKGYIAQDLVDSFPEAYPKGDDDKYMFNPSGMVVYLMKAIQELEAKVAALEAG